ncbi:MAG TPA: FHA domain-containing protein [Thermoanaerobaculia bacterium]|nr:FHA domain-containing protein [Thermoanaerobaculia bacterium]
MLECTTCSTLNPNRETACLSCGSPLAGEPATASTGSTAAVAGGATRTAGASGTVAPGRCPAGHPMGPGWTTCPYCSQPGSGANGGSAASATGPAAGPRPSPPGRLQATRLEQPRGGRATVLHPAGYASQGDPGSPAADPGRSGAAAQPFALPAAAAVAGRLVGVLAAPDLGPGGAVFAVRSGRNTVGSGDGSDVVLDADSEVSREHAVILHRNGTFHLADRLSTNGTWVNGREVPANGTVALADRDRIRLGRTELLFLRVDAPATPSPE